MAHIRYPQDFLKVQRELLTEYHVTNPGDFFSGSDKWRVPRDPSSTAQDQPPVFQSIAMPGEDEAAFSITSPFVPATTNGEGGREILRGLLAVDADAGNQAGKPAADYGLLRLLEYGSATPSGPGQVLNQIKNSPERSQNEAEQLSLAQYITQNSSGGKTLTYGNLLSFPLEGRMFYVQPLYVQAASGSGSFPQNKVVVAVYGNTVAWGDTLGQAVSGLFGEGDAADEPTEPNGPTTPGGTAAAQLTEALTEIQDGLPGRPGRPQGRRLRGVRRRAEAARRRDQAGPGARSAARRRRADAEPVAQRLGDAVAQPVAQPLDHGVTDRLTPLPGSAGPGRFVLRRVGHVRSSHTEHGFFEAVTHSTRGGAAR